jgi:hypothetical protein
VVDFPVVAAAAAAEVAGNQPPCFRTKSIRIPDKTISLFTKSFFVLSCRSVTNSKSRV